MTRTVRDAALVLSAIAGSDPADPATAEADARRGDFAAGLSAESLRGKRIGVMRFASGFGTDAAFEAALRGAARAGRDPGRDREVRGPRRDRPERVHGAAHRAQGRSQRLSRHHPAGGAHPHPRRRHRLQHAPMPTPSWRCSARTRSSRREKTKGLDDPDYRRRARPACAWPGPRGSTGCCRTTMSSPWSGRPCRRPGRSTRSTATRFRAAARGGLAAVAGYPHLTVPMGQVKGLPVGLSFIGAEMVGRDDPRRSAMPTSRRRGDGSSRASCPRSRRARRSRRTCRRRDRRR